MKVWPERRGQRSKVIYAVAVLYSIITTLTCRLIYWPRRRGQRSNVAWYICRFFILFYIKYSNSFYAIYIKLFNFIFFYRVQSIQHAHFMVLCGWFPGPLSTSKVPPTFSCGTDSTQQSTLAIKAVERSWPAPAGQLHKCCELQGSSCLLLLVRKCVFLGWSCSSAVFIRFCCHLSLSFGFHRNGGLAICFRQKGFKKIFC